MIILDNESNMSCVARNLSIGLAISLHNSLQICAFFLILIFFNFFKQGGII